MKRLLTLLLSLILLQLGVKAQSFFGVAVATPAIITPDSVRFQFDTTAADNVAGWTVLTGDPSKVLFNTSIPGTTVNYTTVATANWTQFVGACANTGDGVTNATIPYAGATGVMYESWFLSGDSSASIPQFTVTGLNMANTYDILLSGTTHYNTLNSLGFYTVRGATLQAWQGLQADINGGSANLSSQLTWTNVTPGTGGTFNIYFGQAGGNQASFLSYIIIRKH